MKIRQGFVSNSSSSSFLIGLPRVTTSPRAMQRMLFGRNTEFFYNNTVYSTLNLATIILDNLTVIPDNNIGRIVNVLRRGWWDFCPDDKEPNETWDDYYERCRVLLEEYWGQHATMFKDCVIYTGNFEDHSDLGALIESGAAFERVPHLRISEH